MIYQTTNIHQLPRDLLVEIARHLPMTTRHYAFGRVCKLYHEVIVEHFFKADAEIRAKLTYNTYYSSEDILRDMYLAYRTAYQKACEIFGNRYKREPVKVLTE